MELNEPPEEGVLPRALEPFRGTKQERPEHVGVELLIRLGYLEFEIDAYPRREIPLGWVSDHGRYPQNTDAETDDHMRLKIQGARYLRGMGHEVDTRPIKNASSRHLSVFTCFEEPCQGFTADVVCSCEACETVVEAGYTPPERLLKAFGYSMAPDEDACLRQDEHNPICARTHDYYVDGFYTIPYGHHGDQVTVFKFEPTGKLPDSDMAPLRKAAEAILKGDSAEEE